MDIRINLLPQELRDQLEQRKRQQKIIIISVAVLVIFFAIIIGLKMTTQNINDDIAKLEEQRSGLARQVAVMKPYQELQAKKDKVDKLVKTAVGTPPDYIHLLEGIGLYLPPNLWLTEFSASIEKNSEKNSGNNKTQNNEMLNKVNQATNAVANNNKPTETKNQETTGPNNDKKTTKVLSYGEVIIKGYTLDHYTVANWLKELQRIPQLTDIHCQFSSEEGNNGDLLTTFEIKAALAQSSDAQPPTQKAGE